MIDPQPKLVKLVDVGRCSTPNCIDHVRTCTLYELEGAPGEGLCRACATNTVRMSRVMFVQLYVEQTPQADPTRVPLNKAAYTQLIAAIARRFKITHSAAGVTVNHWKIWRRQNHERI